MKESFNNKPQLFTLGQFISALEALPLQIRGVDVLVKIIHPELGLLNPNNYCSYCLYYRCLSLQPNGIKPTCLKDFLQKTKDCVGKTFFEAGGKFTMSEDTFVWCAESSDPTGNGICGVTLVDSTALIEVCSFVEDTSDPEWLNKPEKFIPFEKPSKSV
jgi:hypothetical protein